MPSVCLSAHPSWSSSTHCPVCPSVFLHVSTHTSTPSSVCPSVCWSSIHPSLHQPTSFLPSTHPSVCTGPSIHCPSLSCPSVSQPTHPAIIHPRLCLSIRTVVLMPFQPFSPSIHLPSPPFICLSSQPSATSRKIRRVDIIAALHQEKLRPGILHTGPQNQLHLLRVV